MGIFSNSHEQFIVGRPTKLEDAEGVKEHIDPELKEVFNLISRGDVSFL